MVAQSAAGAGAPTPGELSHLPSIPPPQGQTPDFAHPASDGTLRPAVLSIGIIFAVLTVVLCGLRIYIRSAILKSRGWDDLWVFIATISACAYTGCVLASAGLVVDVHQWDVSVERLIRYLPLLRAIGYIYFVPTLLATKICLASFFLRLFAPIKYLYYSIWITIAWATFVSFGALFWSIGACAPVGIAYVECSGKTTLPYVVAAGLNIATDVALLIIPLFGVIPLNMNLKKKFAVTLIFLTGLSAVLASCLGLYYRIVQKNSPDITWNFGAVNILSMFEVDTTIIVACLPTLPALFKKKHAWFDNLRSTIQSVRLRLLTSTRSEGRTPSGTHISGGEAVDKDDFDSDHKDEHEIVVQSEITQVEEGRRASYDVEMVAPFAHQERRLSGEAYH